MTGLIEARGLVLVDACESSRLPVLSSSTAAAPSPPNCPPPSCDFCARFIMKVATVLSLLTTCAAVDYRPGCMTLPKKRHFDNDMCVERIGEAMHSDFAFRIVWLWVQQIPTTRALQRVAKNVAATMIGPKQVQTMAAWICWRIVPCRRGCHGRPPVQLWATFRAAWGNLGIWRACERLEAYEEYGQIHVTFKPGGDVFQRSD